MDVSVLKTQQGGKVHWSRISLCMDNIETGWETRDHARCFHTRLARWWHLNPAENYDITESKIIPSLAIIQQSILVGKNVEILPRHSMI